jgi:hypothetical protein
LGEELIYISGDLLVICVINKHASIIASRYHTATPPFYEKFNAFIHEVKIAEENGGASINFAEPPTDLSKSYREFKATWGVCICRVEQESDNRS